jgi:hypothetical protein
MNDVLIKLIEQAVARVEGKSYRLEPYVLKVDSALVKINFDNDLMVLVSKDIDAPITATVEFKSEDNIFITTKTEFSKFNFYQNQVFSKFIDVKTTNYGVNFTSYNLEFLRVIPVYY